MAPLDLTDLKPGVTVLLHGDPHLILEASFSRKSQGKPRTQAKLRNLKTGAVIQYGFSLGEKLRPANLQYRHAQYLYYARGDFTFMDLETYEQLTLQRPTMGESTKYLVEGMEVDLLLHDGAPIGVKLPAKVELTVVKTVPGVRGDTATGGGKPATLESGLTVNTPLFINEGDVVRVNTETGEYVERAS
jgi:elongation factor P